MSYDADDDLLPRPAVPPGLVAFGLAVGIMLIGGTAALWLASSSGSDSPAKTPQTRVANASRRAGSHASDPWPECGAIRAHLAGHVGDPSSLEVVEWLSRKEKTEPTPAGIRLDRRGRPVPLGDDDAQVGDVTIQVRIRAKNSFGALTLATWQFWLRGDRVFHAFDAHP